MGNPNHDNQANQYEELLHAINHDLRTPIGNIRSSTAILLQNLSDPLTEDQRIFIEIIERSTVRLLDQSHRLMLLNQIAFAPFQPKSTQLTELLAQAKHILENSYNISSMTLKNDGDPLLNCDEYTLSATLAMLAAGDIKHQEEQHLPELPTIIIHRKQARLCFTIHSLMPAHEFSHGFIELCNEIIQMHGGELEVSEFKKHKQFKFSLPV
jgi:signal transduction histidine kinase